MHLPTQVLISLTVAITIGTAHANTRPMDTPTLTNWLGYTAGEKVLEIINRADITLRNGESATLIAAEFDRGFHFRYGYILARPKLKQARIIKYWGAQYAGIVVYPRGKRASTVMIGLCDFGWSGTYNERALVQFSGWKPTVRYRWKSWGNNLDVYC